MHIQIKYFDKKLKLAGRMIKCFLLLLTLIIRSIVIWNIGVTTKTHFKKHERHVLAINDSSIILSFYLVNMNKGHLKMDLINVCYLGLNLTNFWLSCHSCVLYVTCRSLTFQHFYCLFKKYKAKLSYVYCETSVKGKENRIWKLSALTSNRNRLDIKIWNLMQTSRIL